MVYLEFVFTLLKEPIKSCLFRMHLKKKKIPHFKNPEGKVLFSFYLNDKYN